MLSPVAWDATRSRHQSIMTGGLRDSWATHVAIDQWLSRPFEHFDQCAKAVIPHKDIMGNFVPCAAHDILRVSGEPDCDPGRTVD
jgi:hypothetical protein